MTFRGHDQGAGNTNLKVLTTFTFLLLSVFRAYVFFSLFLESHSGLGITGGVHRLWAHRSYDAHWTARVFLMLINSMANQGSIYHWSRDHRVHHKYSEMDADPHNATRGFFFAHMGWLYVKKHPDVRNSPTLERSFRELIYSGLFWGCPVRKKLWSMCCEKNLHLVCTYRLLVGHLCP